MPSFLYKAKKGSTEIKEGRLEAQNKEEAIDIINHMGLTPLSVQEEQFKTRSRRIFRSERVSLKETYLMSRQLANLLKTGVPILKAFHLLSQQTQNNDLKRILADVSAKIKDGYNLSDCLSQYPRVFSTLYIAMVQAGEEGGQLSEMIQRISAHLKSQDEIYSKVRVALAYPLLMLFVGIATVIFILTNVMPRVMPLFSQIDQQLPLATRIMITLSQGIRDYWIVISLGIFFAVLFLIKWAKTNSGRLLFHRFLLTVPLFGQLIKKTEISRFSKTLELLLRSGAPLLKAISIASATIHNNVIRANIRKGMENLESGSSFGESLKNISVVPILISHMIIVGEESGSLEETLADIALTYEQDIEESLKTLTALLEPVLILTIGLIVGFMVMAMLLPIFQMDLLAGR